jgi:hypothetical protein
MTTVKDHIKMRLRALHRHITRTKAMQTQTLTINIEDFRALHVDGEAAKTFVAQQIGNDPAEMGPNRWHVYLGQFFIEELATPDFPKPFYIEWGGPGSSFATLKEAEDYLFDLVLQEWTGAPMPGEMARSHPETDPLMTDAEILHVGNAADLDRTDMAFHPDGHIEDALAADPYLNTGEEQGPYIIVYWPDGNDLKLTTRYIGPFDTFGEAYDHLCTLPAPINNGHKFTQLLEQTAKD